MLPQTLNVGDRDGMSIRVLTGAPTKPTATALDDTTSTHASSPGSVRLQLPAAIAADTIPVERRSMRLAPKRQGFMSIDAASGAVTMVHRPVLA